jgi:hypothetical protein
VFNLVLLLFLFLFSVAVINKKLEIALLAAVLLHPLMCHLRTDWTLGDLDLLRNTLVF